MMTYIVDVNNQNVLHNRYRHHHRINIDISISFRLTIYTVVCNKYETKYRVYKVTIQQYVIAIKTEL